MKPLIFTFENNNDTKLMLKYFFHIFKLYKRNGDCVSYYFDLKFNFAPEVTR